MRKLYESIHDTMGVQGSHSFFVSASPGFSVDPEVFKGCSKRCSKGTTHSVQFGCPGKRARVLAGAFLPRIASDAYFRNTTNADPFSPCDDAEKCACAHRSAFLLAANPNQANLRGLLHVHV